MEHSELLDKLKEIVARVTGLTVEEIGDDDHFDDDLGLDSLSMLEVWVEIDREFKESAVKIPNEELSEIETLGEAVSRIQLELAKA